MESSNQYISGTEGIFFDVPDDIYRKAEGVSQTSLKWMEPTPAHYRARMLQPLEASEAQIIGKITHAGVLEGKTEGQYVVKPDGMTFATKEGKAWKAEQTLPILTKEQADNIAGMTDAVKNHLLCQTILHGSKREVSGFKRDERTGLMLKARADVLAIDVAGNTVIPDLKTCQVGEVGPKEFSKSIFNWGYHIQAAHYLDVFGATSFVFIAIEKEPPYAIAIYYLSAEAIASGRAKRDSLLAQFAKCKAENHWPSYPLDIQEIGLPAWANKS